MNHVIIHPGLYKSNNNINEKIPHGSFTTSGGVRALHVHCSYRLMLEYLVENRGTVTQWQYYLIQNKSTKCRYFNSTLYKQIYISNLQYILIYFITIVIIYINTPLRYMHKYYVTYKESNTKKITSFTSSKLSLQQRWT